MVVIAISVAIVASVLCVSLLYTQNVVTVKDPVTVILGYQLAS